MVVRSMLSQAFRVRGRPPVGRVPPIRWSMNRSCPCRGSIRRPFLLPDEARIVIRDVLSPPTLYRHGTPAEPVSADGVSLAASWATFAGSADRCRALPFGARHFRSLFYSFDFFARHDPVVTSARPPGRGRRTRSQQLPMRPDGAPVDGVRPAGSVHQTSRRAAGTADQGHIRSTPRQADRRETAPGRRSLS
jgi:hypothetical protein